MLTFCVALMVAGVPEQAAPLVPAGPWRVVSDDDGIVVEARPVVGTPFEELRATAEMPAPPAQMVGLMWGDGSLKDASPGVSSRVVLRETADTRVYYETVAAPLVSPRDYVLQVGKGPFSLRFFTINDASRPPVDGVVRMPRIVGSSLAEPVPVKPDACRVVHSVFSDIGGAVPAWVARSGQRDSMIGWMKALRARASSSRAAPVNAGGG